MNSARAFVAPRVTKPPWIVNQLWKSETYIFHVLVQIISNGVHLCVDAFMSCTLYMSCFAISCGSVVEGFLRQNQEIFPQVWDVTRSQVLQRDKHQGHWLYPGCGSDATPHLQWFGWYTRRSRGTNSTLFRVCFWCLASRFLESDALWVSSFTPSVLRTVWQISVLKRRLKHETM